MPPFISTSKAVRSLITSRNAAKHLIRSAKNGHSKIDQIRCYSSSIFGISTPSLSEVINRKIDFSLALGSLYNNITVSQRRRFLGCGDGDEGGVLSKVYEERRVMGYSPEQLFDVVASVDLYHGFVPWCQRCEILKRYPDGSFDAELEIGFKFLVESYVSHVELNRPKSVKVASMFFKEVVSKLVASFSDRCRLIYGPGVPVLENSYGQ
ncbi:coenzyme Q-binding protein COQ10 homolog A, mitochondrial isoform X2 [Manihot esculenta]|uniref:Uncharacterized protein n=2 Tax=Manihot esculenta TaxID=3983 RepID=A0ACB7FXS4_MANES|nr:coenzyme Q-binding protein COQ10 homolog A, mitochondrial isoform X2 [Manihot esculenta]KAG8632610.1 hypothetical protein MANES_18G037500v8 [Manihot esculenta]KAG8632611.1 hypothetical protein MANES_18G037500v8 [Manihot esculenta]